MESTIERELIIPKFSWSEITCGEACWAAKHTDCKCSCGGKNHGIWLSGGHVDRTCKINGHRYRLLAVGLPNALGEIQKTELTKYGILRCYDYEGHGNFRHQTFADHFRCRGDKDINGFPLVQKIATLDQCHKWHELGEFAGITVSDRYRTSPSLLWEIIEKPNPVKHKCGISTI